MGNNPKVVVGFPAAPIPPPQLALPALRRSRPPEDKPGNLVGRMSATSRGTLDPPSPIPRLCQTRADRTLPAVANV